MDDRSENELSVEHNRLVNVFQHFGGAILLESEDEKLVLTNQTFCDLIRVADSPDALCGSDCRELLNRSACCFVDPQQFAQRTEQLIEKRETCFNEKIKLENGECWERDYIPVYFDDKFLGHFWFYRNITQRSEAEQIVRESEERYRLLAENMLDLVALHKPDGVFLYVSPSYTKILGYDENELIGKDPYAFFHPEDSERISKESHSRVKEGEVVSSFEYRFRKKNGEYIWLSTSTRPIKDENENVNILQSISRDVTERVFTLQKLEALNLQKDKFFSIIAHDLRSPVSNCVGLIDLLKSEFPNLSPEQELYFKYLQHSISNLQQLLEDLLLWSKSQFGKVAFEPSEVRLREEVDLTVLQMMDAARSKNIMIHHRIDHGIRVFADRHMISTVVRNLLSNGIKFSNPGSEIHIEANSSDGFVEVLVRDNGIGMDSETLSKLFSATTLISARGTHGEKGSGLGLELVRDFIEMHKGTIRVASEPGKGSTFYFTIPVFRS